MKTNVLTLAITLTLGIILAGSLLVPVIEDAQTNIGPEVTVNNTVREPSLNYNMWDGSDITISFTVSGSTGTYSINGEAQTTILTSTTQSIVFASNDVCARIGGTSAPATLNVQHIGDTSGSTYSFTYVIENGEYTFTQLNHDPITGTVDWLIYAADEGDYNAGTINTPTSPFYTTDADKLVILGNVYTTGDKDTFYAYYDGELTVNEDYADNSSVTINKTIADGYTDIYSTTVTVNVGDESFTPYFILAPKSVAGHEVSNVDGLLGAIPIIVIVSLVLLGVGAIYTKRND